MARIMNLNYNGLSEEYLRRDVGLYLYEELVLPEITSKIEIRSNVLPGGAYLERLKELERQSCWTKVQSMLIGTSCCIRKRGFYPKSILYQACERKVSLMAKVDEWRRSGGRCDLAMHLQNRHCSDLTLRAAIREIPRKEVEVVLENLGSGSEGSVRKVSWRNSTYAMKTCTTSFDREHNVALRVLHPHIVTAFGCSVDGDDVDEFGNPARCLLMEVMTEDLFRFAVKNDSTDFIRPPFSRVDSLDVLVQIGMAMDHMHTRNVVHGDLKPHNILISHFEVSGKVRYFLAKVTDFGCAQFITPGQILRISRGIGTNACSAPEVLSRGSFFKYPEKMDVYSFGAVAYELLTGYPASVDHNTKRIRERDLKLSDYNGWKTLIKEHRYPLELIKLVEKCWEWPPEKRPSFSEICEELKRCKSTVQSWEKRSAAIWNFVAVCLFAFICNFILRSMGFV